MKVAQAVKVADARGASIAGRVESISAEWLVLGTGRGRQRIAAADVRKLSLQENVLNGAVVGAVIGIGS